MILGILVALAMVGIVLAASGPAIGWNVIAGGGAPASGTSGTGKTIAINDTLGQPVIGSSTGDNLSMGSGYWYGLGFDETKCGLAKNTTYSFNQTWPVSVTLQTLGTIECLRVQRFDQNHDDRTGTSMLSGVGWGRYWTITATDSSGDPASGFSLTLTLPNEGFATPRSCRFPGEIGGSGWDCDDGTRTTFTASTVTRSGITALSDWAVGNEVGPTAVRLQTFSVVSQSGSLWLAWLGGFSLMVTLGVYFVWRRARK